MVDLRKAGVNGPRQSRRFQKPAIGPNPEKEGDPIKKEGPKKKRGGAGSRTTGSRPCRAAALTAWLRRLERVPRRTGDPRYSTQSPPSRERSEEHTSELQS